MPHRGSEGDSNERGAALMQYAPLLLVIALVVIGAVAVIGPLVGDRVAEPGVHMAGCSDSATLTYPGHELWDPAWPSDGDVNGDGFICVEDTGSGYSFDDNDRPDR